MLVLEREALLTWLVITNLGQRPAEPREREPLDELGLLEEVAVADPALRQLLLDRLSIEYAYTVRVIIYICGARYIKLYIRYICVYYMHYMLRSERRARSEGKEAGQGGKERAIQGWGRGLVRDRRARTDRGRWWRRW